MRRSHCVWPCVVLFLSGCAGSIPEEVWNSESAHKVAATPAEPAPASEDSDAKRGVTPPHDKASPSTRPYVEWTLDETAEDALIRLGPAALPHLERELSEGNIDRQRSAAARLARMGPDAAARVETIELLVHTLENSEDEVVRRRCALALGRIGPSIWPLQPKPYRPITTLAVMPPDAPPVPVDGMEAVADTIKPPTEIRLRLPYDESASSRYERFTAAQHDYDRRLTVARKAVQLLAEMAAADDSTDVSLAETRID